MEYKGQDPKVKVIMLLVTNSCNLNCIYCYENHKSNHYMSLDVAKEAILSEISNDKFDVFSIQFMGGEPLMNYSLMKKVCIPADTRSPIPVIPVHSVGNLQYMWQS